MHDGGQPRTPSGGPFKSAIQADAPAFLHTSSVFAKVCSTQDQIGCVAVAHMMIGLGLHRLIDDTWVGCRCLTGGAGRMSQGPPEQTCPPSKGARVPHTTPPTLVRRRSLRHGSTECSVPSSQAAGSPCWSSIGYKDLELLCTSLAL